MLRPACTTLCYVILSFGALLGPTGAQELVPASAVNVDLIGADGPEFTQVEAAQRLGLDGHGVKICVIDSGVQVTNPNFGACTSPGVPAAPACRIYFGYDAVTGSSDPTPTDENQSHGMAVSGVAVGSFPEKLLDWQGKPLPYQKGVASGALLGAVKADNYFGTFDVEAIVKGVNKSVEQQCDIINLSLGSPGGLYPGDEAYVNQAAQADIVMTTAAGLRSRTEPVRIFDEYSPSTYPTALAVAHLNNTASPGSLLQLDREIITSTGLRSMLVAVQRADTKTSICSPSCDGLKLPLELALLRTVDSQACRRPSVLTTGGTQGKAVVLQFTPECARYWQSYLLWDFLMNEIKPALLLMAMPDDTFTATSVLAYFNQQTPVLWMRIDDGRSLGRALQLNSGAPLQLTGLPGVTLYPVEDAFAQQPSVTSPIGPTADMRIKPDIAAPGTLYTSLQSDTYQTWPGTSMSSAYIAGVVALWMQKQRADGVAKPPGGWVAAAATALKNTARPVMMKVPGQRWTSRLAWPPAKVGAGVVQALSVVQTAVSITPTEMLMKSGAATQEFYLTLSNKSPFAATYRMEHQPAATISLPKSWYNLALDMDAPGAQIRCSQQTVVVPGRRTARIRVTLMLSREVQALDAVVSGYIVFVPTACTPLTAAAGSSGPSMESDLQLLTEDLQAGDSNSTGDQSGRSSQLNIADITAAFQDSFHSTYPSCVSLPLSIAYQGTTKDYSSFGPLSLALMPPPLPELNAAAAASTRGLGSVCLSSPFAGAPCENNITAPGLLRVTEDDVYSYQTLRFTVALLRPVKAFAIQVYNVRGDVLLGVSRTFGPCITSIPLTIDAIPGKLCGGYDAPLWDGSYTAPGSNTTQRIKAPDTYRFRLLLTPYLAAADKAAGVQESSPLLMNIRGRVKVSRSSSTSQAAGTSGSAVTTEATGTGQTSSGSGSSQAAPQGSVKHIAAPRQP